MRPRVAVSRVVAGRGHRHADTAIANPNLLPETQLIFHGIFGSGVDGSGGDRVPSWDGPVSAFDPSDDPVGTFCSGRDRVSDDTPIRGQAAQ